MTTAVISGRVEEGIRQRADVVLRKAGMKPTDVIQNMWAYMARTGEIPDIAKPAGVASSKEASLAHLDAFLSSLPPSNPAYAGWSDDDVLALKAADLV